MPLVQAVNRLNEFKVNKSVYTASHILLAVCNNNISIKNVIECLNQFKSYTKWPVNKLEIF